MARLEHEISEFMWPFTSYKTFSNELCDLKFNSNKESELRASASGSGSNAPNNEAYSHGLSRHS